MIYLLPPVVIAIYGRIADQKIILPAVWLVSVRSCRCRCYCCLLQSLLKEDVMYDRRLRHY